MHLFLSVGEPSGDLHAAKLLTELRRHLPDFRSSGLGGPQMEQAGCQVHYRLTDLAVMGLFAVLPLLGRFIGLVRQVGRWLDEDRPDAVLLVDFPGFNWWVARAARRRGIPVIYMMPPQIWAWGGWRIHKMRRLVQLALCPLEFEQEWYTARHVRARLIGHPFFDEVAQRPLDAEFLARQRDARAEGPVVAILPGSRTQEVLANFPVQLEVMERLHQRFPQARFLIASFKDRQRELCEGMLSARRDTLPVEFHVGKVGEILELADVCLMVSGSVSLEVLARRVPAVVLYRVGWVNWIIGRMLIRCEYISLPNLIARRKIFPEYVLRTIDPVVVEQMTADLAGWLADPIACRRQQQEINNLAATLASPGATQRAAQILIEELGWGEATATARVAA
ncbi:MAG: lipid-A-disaccharide synthase [Planctomycetaceae bacterium]